MIKDSGERTEFGTGAVRDMHSGKGRMDLLLWIWPKASEAGMETVLCRNLEATGILPDGTGR